MSAGQFTVQHGRNTSKDVFYLGIPMKSDETEQTYWMLSREEAARLRDDLNRELQAKPAEEQIDRRTEVRPVQLISNPALADLFTRQAEMIVAAAKLYGASSGARVVGEITAFAEKVRQQYEQAAEICRESAAIVDGFKRDEHKQNPYEYLPPEIASQFGFPPTALDVAKAYRLGCNRGRGPESMP